MNLSALRQQILSSNNTASEKADTFVRKRKVNNLSNDEWRELIAGIPEDVETRIDVVKSAGEQRLAGALSSSDRIRLNGKIAVLEAGDLERGKQRRLSLFRRGDDVSDLRKDGQPAGRLLLVNINNMVSTATAKIEVVGANGESMESFLPEDDGNGLSEELFVFDTVIRVLPFTDKWWRQVWAFLMAQGVALLSLLVSIVVLALHMKKTKTDNTT